MEAALPDKLAAPSFIWPRSQAMANFRSRIEMKPNCRKAGPRAQNMYETFGDGPRHRLHQLHAA